MNLNNLNFGFKSDNLDRYTEEMAILNKKMEPMLAELREKADARDVESCIKYSQKLAVYPSPKIMDYLDLENYDSIFSAKASFAAYHETREERIAKDNEVIKYLNLAIEINPDDSRPYYLLHLLYRFAHFFYKVENKDDYLQKCERYLDKAIELSPVTAEYYIAKGVMFIDNKSKEKYKERKYVWSNLDKALELDKDNDSVHYARSCAFSGIEKNNLEALKECIKAINCNHDHVEYYNIFKSLKRSSIKDVGEEIVDKLIQEEITDTAVLYCIHGWYMYERGSFKQAAKYFAKALEEEPENASYQYRCGCCYLKYMRKHWEFYGKKIDKSAKMLEMLERAMEMNQLTLRCLVMDKVDRLDKLLGLMEKGNRGPLVSLLV